MYTKDIQLKYWLSTELNRDLLDDGGIGNSDKVLFVVVAIVIYWVYSNDTQKMYQGSIIR